jgi:sortase A
MSNIVYKKRDKEKIIRNIRYAGLALFLTGLTMLLYFAFPLISWQIYFAPAFASNNVESPVPKTAVLNSSMIKNMIASAVSNNHIDYNNAQNWFPKYMPDRSSDKPVVTTYNISIPKIHVQYANVSTINTDLSTHLVHYPGTAVPPEKGTGVVFGHSTLPSLFDAHNYKTILAYAHTLKVNDKILVNADGKEYTYEIVSVSITKPDDISIFAQDYDDSYLEIVTCTPPGTTWERLIIKARLQPTGTARLSNDQESV